MKQVVAPLSINTTAGFPAMNDFSLMSVVIDLGFGFKATPSCSWDGS
jgi:hypothetical protein